MDMKQCLQEWQEFDDARPSLPGEHLITATAGVALLFAALRSSSGLASTLQAMVGGALLFRAASGRDGLRKCLESDATSGATYRNSGNASPSDQVELGRS